MLIEINNLSFSYNSKQILSGISFQIDSSRQWAIIGKNGTGKSTLIKCIAGLQKPSSGTIKIKDRPIESYSPRDLARIIAYIPQVSNRNLPYTVYDYVMMGRFPYQGFMAIPTEEDRRIVLEALMLTKLQDLGERKMTTLSGGEQQLVFLAGAVAQQTPILLLDEPTTFLDPYHQQLICRVLDRIRRKFDTAIISITHEVTSFTTQYDNVLALKDGSILYCGTVNDLLAAGPGILGQIFDIPFEVAATASGQKAIVPRAGL